VFSIFSLRDLEPPKNAITTIIICHLMQNNVAAKVRASATVTRDSGRV